MEHLQSELNLIKTDGNTTYNISYNNMKEVVLECCIKCFKWVLEKKKKNEKINNE